MDKSSYVLVSLGFAIALSLLAPMSAGAGSPQYVIGNFNQSASLPSPGSASEPSIAVGARHVFAQLHGSITAFTKDGAFAPPYTHYGEPIFSPSIHQFYDVIDSWCPASYVIDAPGANCQYICPPTTLGCPGTNDPVTVYDPEAQRFYALLFSQAYHHGANGGHIHLAVSVSSDLRDGWRVYHTPDYPDRPSLGFSSDKIVVSALLPWEHSGYKIRVFDKQALLSGQVQTVNHEQFNSSGLSNGIHQDLAPQYYVDLPGPSMSRACANQAPDNDAYVMNLSFGTLTVGRITGTVGGSVQYQQVGTASLGVAAPTTARQRSGSGWIVLPQKGPILAGQQAVSNPFVRNGVITLATHESDGGATPVNRLRVFRVQANMSSLTVLNDLTYGAPGVSYAFASAVSDAAGNLYVGFDASSETTYPSCYLTAMRAGETSLETPPTLMKAGEATFTLAGGYWGDFTEIALDECGSGPATAYFHGQWATSGGHALQGWITSFRFEDPPPTACDDPVMWHHNAPATMPSPRWDATLSWDPNTNSFVLFGGFDGTSYLNDAWLYNPAGNSWWQLTPSGGPPAGRRRHTAILDPLRNRLVVFGGEDASGRFNDTWSLSLVGAGIWSQLSTSGGPPSVRCSHVAIYDPVRDQMVINGGVPWVPAHTWKLTFPGNQWTQIAAGPSPLGLEGCSSIYDPIGQRMLVFGGRTYVGAACPSPWLWDLNETYSLDLAAPGNWVQLFPSGSTPARAFATAVYDGGCQRMLVYGGIQDEVCDIPCGQYLENGSSAVSALSLTGPLAWTTVTDGCYEPTPRGHHGAAYSSSSNAFYVFGGGERPPVGATCAITYHNDIWRVALADEAPPAAVTNLTAILSKYNGILNWTAPGDDGSIGRATQYDIRRSLNPITESNFSSATPIAAPTPGVAGTLECADVTGLTSCTWYYFALKSRDEKGNWSALGNVLYRKTQCKLELEISCDGLGYMAHEAPGDEADAGPARVALSLASENPARTEVQISYEIPRAEDGAALELSVFDVLGRRVHTVLKGQAQAGIHETTWKLRDSRDVRVKKGIYFIRLRVGAEQRGQKVFVLD